MGCRKSEIRHQQWPSTNQGGPRGEGSKRTKCHVSAPAPNRAFRGERAITKFPLPPTSQSRPSGSSEASHQKSARRRFCARRV